MRELAPIKISKTTWMYAEPKGLCVVHEIGFDGYRAEHTAIFYIPWSKVRLAVGIDDRRKERKPKPRSRT